VLHVIGHGVPDPDRTAGRGVQLAGGTLAGSNLEVLPRSNLVVLSACRAAAAPQRPGDAGSADLGGALLAAGAQAVVLSHDDLAFEATLELTEIFHRELVHGATPAAALHLARAALRARSDRSDPYYHALVQVQGLGHVPLFTRATTGDAAPRRASRGWLVGIGVVVGAGLLWGVRRARATAPSAAPPEESRERTPRG
jgi:hypothetical protein